MVQLFDKEQAQNAVRHVQICVAGIQRWRPAISREATLSIAPDGGRMRGALLNDSLQTRIGIGFATGAQGPGTSRFAGAVVRHGTNPREAPNRFSDNSLTRPHK